MQLIRIASLVKQHKNYRKKIIVLILQYLTNDCTTFIWFFYL